MNIRHIHLDTCGGIAGDMFTAAIVDACPEFQQPLLSFLKQLDCSMNPQISIEPFTDQVLCGQHFTVSLNQNHSHEHHHDHEHHHTHWSEIREWIVSLSIEEQVKHHAIGIFELLAEAEAKVHNKTVASVAFHEVGAWDSIIDILSAAWLIHQLQASSWSVSMLPWGGGLAKTDHGLIPVPAPATIELLKDFAFFDDDIKGERITPTGAAILSWLKPSSTISRGKLIGSGHGFGTKQLQGMSNILRVCLFDIEGQSNHSSVIVMECDIDDQSPESLAVGIDTIRKTHSVIDVVQIPAYGKKGRLTTQLRILVKPSCQQAVADCIFAHTTTLGVRWYEASRFELPRSEGYHQEHGVRVKYAERPGIGKTAKAEMDDIATHGHNHYHRESLRRTVELEACQVDSHEH
ncbi:LarC family nickel insertion protein [Endozoicomonas atrinae]|uniref:LarC family nickel insertion protein n=1 Tax=Endozoicomonas atrinae TaxID=1333660 RepID=UPI0008261923|nr:LarC family nickel insertion protein [Endozoicomonas atrinae]